MRHKLVDERKSKGVANEKILTRSLRRATARVLIPISTEKTLDFGQIKEDYATSMKIFTIFSFGSESELQFDTIFHLLSRNGRHSGFAYAHECESGLMSHRCQPEGGEEKSHFLIGCDYKTPAGYCTA